MKLSDKIAAALDKNRSTRLETFEWETDARKMEALLKWIATAVGTSTSPRVIREVIALSGIDIV